MAFLIGGANSAADTGYDVANSCRFNDGDSARCQKDFADGHDTAATISLWFKRCTVGAAQTLLECHEDANNYFRVRLESSDELQVRDRQGGSDQLRLKTDAKFRDPSAWYSLIIIIDTTDGTAADRCKVYINGTRVTSFETETTYGSSDTIETGNADCTVNIGGSGGSDNYLDGYMAEVVFLDGVSQASSGFGEFNSDSPTIWQPIDVSGLTFGTNGFYLDFEASDNLGNDANGGTDLTEANLAAVDQATDTPTNSFCTFNPLYRQSVTLTLSEGNCKVVTDDNDTPSALTTMGMTAGKWYCEFKLQAGTSSNVRMDCGVTGNPQEDARNTDYVGEQDYGYAYVGESGNKRNGEGIDGASYGDAMSIGDIIGVALDLDNLKIYFAKNNTWQNSGDPTTGATGTGAAYTVTAVASAPELAYFFSCSDHSAGFGQTIEANFGGCSAFALSSAAADANGYGNFEYAPPSGYLSLCTKNLGSDGG